MAEWLQVKVLSPSRIMSKGRFQQSSSVAAAATIDRMPNSTRKNPLGQPVGGRPSAGVALDELIEMAT
jgi:hypothetical protein